MIGRQTKGKSFRTLVRGWWHPPERVVWTRRYNLLMLDPVEIAREMEDFAAVKERCLTPALHQALYWHPDDNATEAQMVLACERVLACLELQEHQAYVVAHNDTPHDHVHIMVNRVHPAPGGKVWGNWGRHGRPWTFRAVESALRLLEQEMGWAVTPGHNAPTPVHKPPPSAARAASLYQRRLSEEITAAGGAALQDARSWADLTDALRLVGVHVEARENGMVLTDGRRYIAASRVRGLAGGRRTLEKRFGQDLDDFLATGQAPAP